MKIVEKSFFNDLYGVDISFLFGGDVEDLKKFIRARHGTAKLYSWDEEFNLQDHENNTDAMQFHIFTLIGNADKFYLWNAAMQTDLLFHEIFHLVGDILFVAGIRYSTHSEESYSYLAGWIGRKIFEQLGVKLRMPK